MSPVPRSGLLTADFPTRRHPEAVAGVRTMMFIEAHMHFSDTHA